MRYTLQRSLPLLALAGIGWLFWSAGRAGPPRPVGLLPQPKDSDAFNTGAPAKTPVKSGSGTGKKKSKSGKSAAPKPGTPANSGAPVSGFPQVRAAGPAAMKDPPRDWDEVDEENDESFPASDPPGRY